MSDPRFMRSATYLLCFFNVLAALYLCYFLAGPLYFSMKDSFAQVSLKDSSAQVSTRKEEFHQDSSISVKETADAKRIREEGDALRVALQPNDLIKRVKEIQAEIEAKAAEESRRAQRRDELALEVAARLEKDHLPQALSISQLEDVASFNEEELTKVLGELKQPMPDETEILPGPPVKAKCGMEKHTDLDGVAITWGITHLKDTAAECCEACMLQRAAAKEGEKKCTTWVFCPRKEGCWAPDIYDHKHRECWLKQADTRRVNAKGAFSEKFREEHKSAPSMVEWVSGSLQ